LRKSRDRIQSLERAGAVLGAFDRNIPELSISELAERVRLARTTVHRIVMSLAHIGYLRCNPVSGKYKLGYGLLNLGARVLQQETVRQDARPFLLSLFESVHETIFLAVRDGQSVVYIDRLQPEQMLQIGAALGGRSPLHCSATGKAILMATDPQERLSLLRNYEFSRLTPNTAVSVERLVSDLEQGQQSGFSLDLEESGVGICGVGAPIFGADHRVLAAFSVAAPTVRVSKSRLLEIGKLVRDTSIAISRVHWGDRGQQGTEQRSRS
jgi:DNA-binding IclR family transcriptional regulator